MKFPVIRYFSSKVTPALLYLPVSANNLTFLALTTGGVACWMFTFQDRNTQLVGAFLFSLSYLLDNCDGEVARAKNQSSKFGDRFDTFVDWIVHACFFSAVGFQVMETTGEAFWLWLGFVSSLGCSINYFREFI